MSVSLEYATEADWIAIDCCGQIAFLRSGFGPIPARLGSQDEITSRMKAVLLSLPIRSAITSHRAGMGASDFVDLACRGIFGFQWSNDNGPYLKVIAPNNPVAVSEVTDVSAGPSLAELPTISFDSINYIETSDIAQYRFTDIQI